MTMTIGDLKRYLRQWEEQGLTDDSPVLAYSDRNGHAEGSVGVIFLAGSRPGSFGVMFAPGSSRSACEKATEIPHVCSVTHRRQSDA